VTVLAGEEALSARHMIGVVIVLAGLWLIMWKRPNEDSEAA